MKWPRYSLFLILCLVLIIYQKIFPSNVYNFGFYNKRLNDFIYHWILYKFPHWEPNSIKVLISYLIGSTLKNMNELKNAHETLNLLHLLSPSAFHLLCLNWIFSRLFSPSVTFIIYIFMILVGYTLVPLHPAFIRSLTLTAFLLLFKNKQHDLIVFCILFLDFYFGTYHLMPMSYIFSFVILGHIYLLPSNFSMMKKVIISQLLLCLFFSQNFNIINFFFGFNLGLVFLPILTLIIFYFLLIPGTWPIIASWLELIYLDLR